ncbi:acylneuraminate cytidylyltransferase family protein [Candidatus Puniceispirillum sp.]|nr:acylneuraminate cytidylyltransferase family protein [Candidatus Puniceispirillum sp.]
MIDFSKMLVLIPARGGSKGIFKKNIKPLCGQPLINWTITEALKSKYISDVIVSTDDDEIAQISKNCGAKVPFIRPAELAKDDTPGVKPALHALEELDGFESLLLLQPTSPLRIVEDINGLLKKVERTNLDSIASITATAAPLEWTYYIDENDRLFGVKDTVNLTARQDAKATYNTNGAMYWVKAAWLRDKLTFVNNETFGYLMPPERSIDIDSFFDWLMAELIIKDRVKNDP